MDIIGLIVALVLIALAFWAAKTLSAALGIPPVVIVVLNVVLAVIAILIILAFAVPYIRSLV